MKIRRTYFYEKEAFKYPHLYVFIYYEFGWAAFVKF